MITIPTLSEIYTGIISDLETKYGSTIPTFGKSFLRALAGVQAGKIWLNYKVVGFTQKNIFADTADSELIGGTLERFGRVKLGRNPFPATAGEYVVSVTGTAGAVIPTSTTFKSDDNSASPGYLFVLDNPYTLTGTSDEITLRALTSGPESRLEVGNTLTVTAPIALVNASVEVTSEDVEPIEAESLEDYRRKVLDAYRLEPQGGAGADYRLWSFDVSGVRQAYPYAVSGNNNEINLYIESTIAASTDGKGTSSVMTLDNVRDAIELPQVNRPSRKPLGVFEINYLSIDVKDVSINISGFVGITPAIETAIETSIIEELSNVRPFVSSIDILANKNDIFDTNKIISIILSVAPGSQFGAVTMEVDSIPVSSFTFEGGDIPSLDSISYV
jgi:hypothetical protein